MTDRRGEGVLRRKRSSERKGQGSSHRNGDTALKSLGQCRRRAWRLLLWLRLWGAESLMLPHSKAPDVFDGDECKEQVRPELAQ